MLPFELTEQAKQDLKEIYRYTITTWSEGQAERYAARLDENFFEIANQTAIVRMFSSLDPEIMVSRCEHHYIFFTHQRGQKPRIFAVLHERMNQLERLKERL